MKVHHISCGRFRPPIRLLTQGDGGLFERADYVVHCLLVELPGKLALVDTGMAANDMAHPLQRLGAGMAWGAGARRGPTALEHVKRLGYSAGDITDIVMTHLDKDHAGGLADFPNAVVHVHQDELSAASARRSLIDKQRYNPRHLAHSPTWLPLGGGNRNWHGFQSSTPEGLPDSLQIALLPGHSSGHCGVALQQDDGTWLLHCGDAVYHPAWLEGRRPPAVIQAVEKLLEHDGRARKQVRERLQELMADPHVTIFCSHDRGMFEKLGGIE